MTLNTNFDSASVCENYTDISHLNTMALACKAKALVCFQSIDEILPVFQRLQQSQQSYVIISNGSNIILPPVLHATVISPTLKGKKIINETADHIFLEVMAGESWHELVVETVNHGWYGLENLALIPSWVGGSPVQNIGAYGVQIEEVIDCVTAFHIPTLTWQTLSRTDCQFGYRDSIFKHQIGQWLITSVTFKLHKQPFINTQYGDVAQVAEKFSQTAGRGSNIMPNDIMNAIIQIRQSKIPDTNDLPNCGSFFKNPIVDKQIAEQLLIDYPNLVSYPVKDHIGVVTNQVKLAAGWLIDQAGLKGKGIEPILTHVKQALVLTNHAPRQATQMDIAKTMTYIQTIVQQKFGINLESEPVWIEPDGSIRQTH